MNREPRVVMLTSNGVRHRWAAARLAKKTNLVGIVSEAKTPVLQSSQVLPESDRVVIEQHFEERDAVERRMLGTELKFPDTHVLEVPQGAINTEAVFEWVQQQLPDVIALYGTSLIKPPILSHYDGRIINIHLGLSPYYRGSGTNFWPLVYREPEYVGATIHLAVASVDAGGILAQLRPVAEFGDRAHEMGTKTIMAGFELMPVVLGMYVEGRLKPHGQTLSEGKVFKRKDFNAEAVRMMRRNFESGMMAEYLANAGERCQRCPIVEIPSHVA